MTAASGEVPLEGFGPSPELDSIAELDVSAAVFLGACRTYAGRPNEQNYAAISTTARTHISAFDAALESMAEDSTPHSFAAITRTVLQGQDSYRVDAFNEIFGEEDLFTKVRLEVEDTDADDEDDDGQSNPDEIKARCRLGTVAAYGQLMGNDVRLFLMKVSESDAAQAVKRREALLQHAVDIGKVAVGTAIGMLFIRSVSRGRLR